MAFEVGHQIRTALEGHPCRVLMAPVDVLLLQAGVLAGVTIRWEPIVARLLGL